MKQAVMVRPGAIEYRDVPAPAAGAGEVLLRIKRIGICGSDIHVNHGLHPFTTYPVVQGHEFSAVVESVGPGVAGVRPGMKATARPQLVCGECKPCRRGDYNICDRLKVEGFQAPGVAQELFVTAQERLVVLPDSMSFEQGAMVEPAAVAVHAVDRGGEIAGKNVVVLGAGAIGNLVAQAARCRGAKSVLIVDLSDFRLEAARKCGTPNGSNAGREPLRDAAKRVFGAEGFELAFEAAGAEAALEGAVGAIQKGGRIVVVGVFGQKPRVHMSGVTEWQLSLVGTLMYTHKDYEKAVELIAGGQIVTAPLVTAHFPFERYAEAYALVDKERGNTLKVMIDL